ncbi:hypothetical protein IMZ48_49905 [Candidatus Bathyarchaeota archaeon]|nr:hypothetical protein [Candidatus Bathyarchaeota archaeon]
MEVLQSLRQLLLNSDAHVSLSRKVRRAPRSTSCVHALSFVHKNMRPESVLCLEDAGSGRSHAFLVGIDAIRAAGAGIVVAGDIS